MGEEAVGRKMRSSQWRQVWITLAFILVVVLMALLLTSHLERRLQSLVLSPGAPAPAAAEIRLALDGDSLALFSRRAIYQGTLVIDHPDFGWTAESGINMVYDRRNESGRFYYTTVSDGQAQHLAAGDFYTDSKWSRLILRFDNGALVAAPAGNYLQ